MKKHIKIIIVVLVIVLSSIFVILLFQKKEINNVELVKEPISVKEVGESKLEVEIPPSIQISEEFVSIYTVKPANYKEEIEGMMSSLSLFLEEAEYSDDNFIDWNDGENKFGYDSITNILMFELSEPIYLGTEEESFKEIFFEYFDRKYEFFISEREVLDNNTTNYYAKRILDDIPMERGYGYKYTDILRFDKIGRVKGGSLLLAEAIKEDSSVPIVSKKELLEYINLNAYPKESYVYATHIMENIDLHYLDPRWDEIHNSASNCQATDSELIYLYKTSNQEVLFPTFKMLASCEVEFEKEKYIVPAVFYVNAVKPDYVTTQ